MQKGKLLNFEFQDDESEPLDSKPRAELSSDDDEANEDLSLKIVEKALLMKAAKLNESKESASDDGNVVPVVNLASLSSPEAEIYVAGTSGVGDEVADLDLKSKKVVKRKKKKTKVEKQAIVTEDRNKTEMIKKVETVEEAAVGSLDPNTVDISDNIVLRKLLRGPRYFDPPDSGWQTCYNCGEEGHMAVNCPSASKRKKPCFICGSLEHNVRQCSKAQDCFICKKRGHRAKDCPDKHKSGSKNSKICLRCGDSGHEMFSCKRDYSHDDLKDLRCYICKNFGHLCCVNFVDTSSREVSCYRCGQLGHTGLSCGKSHGLTKETSDNGSPSLCFKCGEGGHFARECINGTAPSSLCYKCGDGGHFARDCSSAKVGKIYRESSTPKVRSRRENKDIWGYKSATRDHGKSPKRTTFLYEENDDFFGYKSAPHGHGKSPKRKTFLYEENDNFFGYKSAPHDHGKSPKRKKIQYEEKGLSTPRHIKQRGGWIAEDPEEFSHSHRKSKRNHWSSPSTPSYEGRMKSITSSGRASGSQSSKQNSHRYSASRFNNFGHNEPGTNYHWW